MKNLSFQDFIKSDNFLENVIKNATNWQVKEALKRKMGFPSATLGRGPTKADVWKATTEYLFNSFIKERLEAAKNNFMVEKPITEDKKEEEEEEKEETKNTENSEDEPQTKVQDGWTLVQRLCKNYIRKRCTKGRECQFKHPDPCQTFVKFGPQKKTNPKGCSGEKQCGLFHSRNIWCSHAMKHNECKWGKDCKYKHFHGIITTKPTATSNTTTRDVKLQGSRYRPDPHSFPKLSYSKAASERNSFLSQAQDHHHPPQQMPSQIIEPNLNNSLFQILMKIDKRLQSLEGSKTNSNNSLF